MLDKRFDAITADDILALVANKVREGRRLDYKMSPPGTSDKEKKEFLADVASFANSSGGDIIYGVTESVGEDGKNTGLPECAKGLKDVNIDETLRRLESLVRDGIDPRIQGVRLRAVDGLVDGPALVIRLPRSWNAPHMVSYQMSPRFFARSSAGKMPLDIDEIRAAFVRSASIPDQVRRFRDERIGRLIANDGAVPLDGGVTLALHVVPIEGMLGRHVLDPRQFEELGNLLRPMECKSSYSRFTLEGWLTHWGYQNPDGRVIAYAQWFRNGSVEAVSVMDASGRSDEKLLIRPYAFQDRVIEFLERCKTFFERFDIDGPIAVMLSFLSVRGSRLYRGELYPDDSVALTHDHLLLPEFIIEETGDSWDVALRPMFDLVYQSFGYPRSPNFGADGHYRRS